MGRRGYRYQRHVGRPSAIRERAIFAEVCTLVVGAGDLIASLVQPAKDAIDAFLDEAERSVPARELLEGFFDLNHRHRRIFLALVRDPTGLDSVDAEGWVTELAAHAQRLLAGDDPTPDQRIRAVVAINALSRCATVLTDIPHQELRQHSVDLALQIINGENSDH